MGKVAGPVEPGGPSGGSAVELLLDGVWGLGARGWGVGICFEQVFPFLFLSLPRPPPHAGDGTPPTAPAYPDLGAC